MKDLNAISAELVWQEPEIPKNLRRNLLISEGGKREHFLIRGVDLLIAVDEDLKLGIKLP
jgi:hypothetical protein